MVRKPKGSHLAYKEWAPSVKLSQQNIIRLFMVPRMFCRFFLRKILSLFGCDITDNLYNLFCMFFSPNQ